MSIMIREYLGYDKFDVEHNYKEKKNLKENFVNYEDPIIPESLMVDIEGIHVGPTRNFTRYMERALKSSEKSWTHPYNKPLIMHHNEKDGKIIGRIHAVKYTDVNTRSGTGALIFTSNVPDKDGMEQIEDGRLMTTSIGIIGHDVRCSICNTNIAEEGECEHERGQVYNGETCYWDIYEMEGKELSYVIVPSDIYAKNIKVYKPSALKKHLKEEDEETHKKTKNLKEGDEGMAGKATKTELDENKELSDLKESFAKLEEEKKALETKLAENNNSEKIAELEESNNKLSEEIKESKETASKLEKEVSDLKESLNAKEEELKETSKSLTEEKELREALETKSIELKESSKQALVENYAFLRKVSGKEVGIDSIKERSLESLMDSIKDIKEELGDKLDFSSISLISDPTLTEEINKGKDKKDKKGDIDLQEGLESLFSDIAMIHKK